MTVGCRPVARRATQLETPPPGSRCPACWVELVLNPRSVSICPRCFVFVLCLAPGRLQPVLRSDLVRLAPAHRFELCAEQAHMITVGSNRWRSRPPPAPYRGPAGPYRTGQG